MPRGRERTKHLRAPLVAGVVCLAVAWGTTPTTDLELRVEAERLVWQVDGEALAIEATPGRARALGIQAHPSVFPVGLGPLTVKVDDEVRRYRLPRWLPRRAEGAPPALGDWWVDARRSRPMPMAEIALDGLALEPPYTVRTHLRGRAQGPILLTLRTDDGAWGFQVHRGLLRQRSAIGAAGGELAARDLTTSSGRHAAGMVHGLAWAAAAGSFLALLAGLVAVGGRAHGAATSSETHGENGGPIRSPLPRGERARVRGVGPTMPAEARVRTANLWLVPAGLLVLCATGLALWRWVTVSVLQSMPHLQDGFCYLLRAGWLLDGEARLRVGALGPHVDAPFTMVRDGVWFTQYPVGWPALLAVGRAFDATYWVPPLCGVATVVAVVLLGRHLYGATTGLLAGLLLVTSPMAALLFASTLSHAGALALLSWCTYLTLRAVEASNGPRGRLCLLGAGLLAGYAFGVRPLTAVAMTVPLGLYAAGRALQSGRGKLLAAGLAGTVLGALPALIDNWRVTGSPFTFAYQVIRRHGWSLDHLAAGLEHGDSAFALVGPLFVGWTWAAGPWITALSYGLVFVPLLWPLRTAGSRCAVERLLLIMFLALPLAYLGHDDTGIHGYGPRFYADAFFVLWLLAARGLVLLAGLPLALRSRGAVLRRAPALIVAAAIALLTAASTHALLRHLPAYRGYNWVDGDLEHAVAEAGIERGVILIDDHDLQWIRAGNLMPPSLDAPLQVFNAIGDERALRTRYPDLPIYRWRAGRLAPLDP